MLQKFFKKFIGGFLAGLLIVSPLLTSKTTFAEFSDLSDFHPNYDAILYLQENDVLHGYPDGTFKPNNPVNRAEFLKIILEGSGISLNVSTETPFPDVNHSAWYGPYIKKAFAEGWIVGYPDGTFKPDQTINKVEALKILGEVQNWQMENKVTATPFNDTPLGEWYIKYVSYAKEQGYLEESGKFFLPATLMTRAKISEIIYRTLTLNSEEEVTVEEIIDPTDSETNIEIVLEEEMENSTSQNESPDITSEDPLIKENFTPVGFKAIDEDFYDTIELDETLPNHFYNNEIYIIEGEVTSGNYDHATIYLSPLDGDIKDYRTFSGELKNNHFSIPVYFETSGNYYFGVIPGLSGQTKVKEIAVLSNLPASDESLNFNEKASTLQIDYSNDTTKVNFTAPDSTLKKVTFFQGNKKVTYLSRQDIESLDIYYKDFANFSESKVEYYIQTAKFNSDKPLNLTSDYTTSDIKSFTAIEHTFDDIDYNLVTTSPPDMLSSPTEINFSGIVDIDVQKTAYVIKPDGLVDKVNLSTSSTLGSYYGTQTILDGGVFEFDYDVSQNGRYIVEINDKTGLPIVNHPVYIGNSIPLIPDFFDLNEREFFSGNFNLDALRNELLDYINESREEHGLNAITMNDDLNDLAQNHSYDMAENNFFSHVNPQDQTPDDRRVEAGIPTPVSENIAKDVAVDFGHFGLMRSAAHRENILNSNWTEVGLGIVEDDGYLIITEEFSTSAITESDLNNFKDELFEAINDARTNSGNSALTYNPTLELASEYLNDKVIDENASLTNDLFNEVLSNYEINGTSQALGRIFNIWQTILESFVDEEVSLIQENWDDIGIDIQLDETGNIHVILIINKT